MVSTADADRYPNNSAAHANTLQSKVRLDFNEIPDTSKSKNNDTVPYFTYQSTLNFPQDFAQLKSSLNDWSAGITVSKTYPSEKQWPAQLDATATRRYSNASSNSKVMYANPSIRYIYDKFLSAAFTPSAQVRWFDENMGVTRRDIKVVFPLRVAFIPSSWFRENRPLGEIQVNVIATRNYSSMASQASRIWNISPSVSYASGF